MECNKDEAIRAKDIAGRKFSAKDFSGAKKFALKAQTLYPGLDGISQMLTTLNVHISAENKVGGETDLYGILGVSPLADDDTIKKQYRKLVLQLHPDKNKSVGADGAFFFVTEAFNVLSDKTKRSAFNTRREMKMAQKVPSHSSVYQKVSTGGTSRNPYTSTSLHKEPSQSGSLPYTPVVNGSRKHPVPALSRGKLPKGGTRKASEQVQSFFPKGDTFWTVCAECKMQYEYMRIYINQMLKCPNCEQCFVAVEIAPPSNLVPLQAGKLPSQSSSNLHPRVSSVSNSFGGASARWSPLSGMTTYRSMGSLKREGDGSSNADSVFRGEGASKKMRGMSGNFNGSSNQFTETGRVDVFEGWNEKVTVDRVMSTTDSKTIVSEMALMDIRSRVKSWKLACGHSGSVKYKAKFVKERRRQKSRPANSMQEPKSDNIDNNNIDSQLGSHVQQEAPDFSVPDPDFHVFDYDRSEHCFKGNQVWAAYDNDDGMPRFYALIHEVAPSKTFKLKLSWLNSRSTTEFGPLDWVNRGFRKICGDFWVGKYENYNLLNSFSHKVNFDKGPRGVIQIYPREGQIWALYQNWSPDWNKYTPEKTRHAYEMVEVLQDYKDEQGVNVAHIIKAPGFRTVYSKQEDPKVVKHIPKDEMFRFSHQVPHHILTGSEKPNAPKGLMELDPAATSPELLYSATSADEEQSIKH